MRRYLGPSHMGGGVRFVQVSCSRCSCSGFRFQISDNTLPWEGPSTFCLQKSRMLLAGLVYFIK